MTTSVMSSDLAERADLLLTDFRARIDPWALFDEMRREAPVMETSSGVWMATRYADCQSLLRDPRLSRKEAARRTSGLSGEDAEHYTTRLVCEDGADHRRMRAIVNQAFSARNIAVWHPLIEELAADAVFTRPGRMDFLEDFARPLSIRALSRVLGVPYEDRPTLEQWMGLLLEHVTGKADAVFLAARAAAMSALVEYLRRLVDQRRVDPTGTDLVSQLIRAHDQEERLSERELLGILAELLHAGYESTATVMTCGVLCFLEHPDQAALLAAQPERAKGAVEEILRYSPPSVLRLPRVALTDIEISGMTIPQGAMVMALSAAANRDPTVYDRPHEFDITRRITPHMSFGLGEHYCVGNALARTELVTTFTHLARTCLTAMHPDGPFRWRDHHIVRGPESLPVAW